MDFKSAVDGLCNRVDHSDVAAALGVSVQAIRQARLGETNGAHRSPPRDWENAVLRLAEERVWHYRKLIESLRDGGRESAHQ